LPPRRVCGRIAGIRHPYFACREVPRGRAAARFACPVRFATTGSFQFFGVPIPSVISLTVNGSQLTFVETTVWGTGSSQCANTYGGTLTKQ
jgi:hypothetical protein